MLTADGSTTSRCLSRLAGQCRLWVRSNMGRNNPSPEMDLPSGTSLAYWLVPCARERALDCRSGRSIDQESLARRAGHPFRGAPSAAPGFASHRIPILWRQWTAPLVRRAKTRPLRKDLVGPDFVPQDGLPDLGKRRRDFARSGCFGFLIECIELSFQFLVSCHNDSPIELR